MHRFSTVVLIGTLTLAIGCGGGSNTPAVNKIATPTQNVQAITVDGGSTAFLALNQGLYTNAAFVTITVCAPGSTASCQQIDHILVDTGSVGLRLLSASSGGEFTVALPPSSVSGNLLGECVQFADLTFLWGPVETADIKIAGEVASSIPVNVVGDATFSADSPVPSSCGVANGPLDDDSLLGLGANGILGVGSFAQDCGPGCVSGTPPSAFYYQCPSSGCAPSLVSLATQVQNPVSMFAADNNGVIVELPAVPIPQATLSGSLVFGIGTQANNGLGSAAVFPIDLTNFGFTTNYKNQAYPGSFIDSGSNGIFFLDSTTTGIPECPDTSFWYCPALPTAISVTNQSTNGSPSAFSFTIGNFDQLTVGSNAAISALAGPNSGLFDWGLPFFYGKSVFTSIQGTTAPGGQTPYWAY